MKYAQFKGPDGVVLARRAPLTFRGVVQLGWLLFGRHFEMPMTDVQFKARYVTTSDIDSIRMYHKRRLP